MSKEIDAKVSPEIESKKIEVGEWGLEFKGQLTIEEWHNALLEVQKYDGKIQWYLGDLAVYAESPVTGWGETKYDKLLEHSGYEYGTLANFASTARRFSQSFRESVLKNGSPYSEKFVSFNHFRIVQSLDDAPARHFLEMVRDARWTTEKLRTEVAKYKNGGVLPEKVDEELPVGYTSFKDVGKKLLKGYSPEHEDKEYDEVSWLVEIRDWANDRLHELGVEG